MPTLAELNKGISLVGERIVVVGATQGIGEGIAWRFAQAGAEVWIVGRNETLASGVLDQLKATSAEQKMDPAPEHTFFKADLSLVSEAKRLAREMRGRAGPQGIDYLVLSQGGPPNGAFVTTSEGYERHYGVQILSRFILAHELAGDPASSTVKKGVMTIMAPGKGFGSFDADDIDLRKAHTNGKYGLLAAMSRDSIVGDAYTADLAKGNSKATFTHVYPGAVKTAFASNSEVPWYFSLAASIAGALMGATPKQFAEVPFHLLAHPEGRKVAARDMFFSEKLVKQGQHATFKDETVREKIRSHLLSIADSKT